MKKLTLRDQMLIVVMIIVGILAAFYYYVYTPFDTKVTQEKSQRDSLQTEATSDQTNSLSSKIKQLTNQLNVQTNEKRQFEKERMITRAQQEKLLLYIGQKANEMGINLVKFEEKPNQTNNSSYNVVGYDIKARGDSKDLVLFLNSIYSFYNYCYITDFNLRKVAIQPSLNSDNVKGLSTDDKSNIDWSDDQINLILMDIPPYLPNKDSANSGSSSNSSSNTQTNVPTEKGLQLDFSLYFILSD